MTNYQVTHTMFRYEDMKAASSEEYFRDSQGILLQMGLVVQGNPSVGAITKFSAQTNPRAAAAADRGLYIVNNGNQNFSKLINLVQINKLWKSRRERVRSLFRFLSLSYRRSIAFRSMIRK